MNIENKTYHLSSEDLKSIHNMRKVTMEDIKKALEEFEESREPDVIITEGDGLFMVSIPTKGSKEMGTRNVTLRTGIGGFKLYLENLGNFKYMCKIKYNGVILDEEQKIKFINQILGI